MPLTTANITGNITDLVGAAFPLGHVRITVETTQPLIADTGSGGVRLGSDMGATIADNGDVTITGLPVTDTGTPLYRLVIEGRSNNQPALTLRTGWFELTASRTLEWVANNAVDITTVTADILGEFQQLRADVAADRAAVEAVVATNDGIMTSVVNDSGSSTTAALSGQYVRRAGDHSGGTPYMEYSTVGGGAVLHLLAGVGSTAPYVIGVGVDHDNSPTGVYTSVKGNNSTGIGTTLETTSGAGSTGFLAQTFGPGKLLHLIAGNTASGPMLTIQNIYGGTSDLLVWDTLTNDGKVDQIGNLTITGSTAGVTAQNAASNQNRAQVRTNNLAAILDFDHYSGTPGLWFAHRIDTNANSLRIRKGDAATGLGSATYSTLLEFKDNNTIGFFGVTPVTRRTLPAAGSVTAANIRQALIDLGLCQ